MCMKHKDVERLRAEYPEGSRIVMVLMEDDPRPIAPGSVGTVNHVDDAGQIHISWDSGRTLAVIPGVDKFRLASEGR